MENQSELKWHQNPTSIILLLVFFFPLGLYFMWKNELWSSKVRMWVSVFFALLVIAAFNKEGVKETTNYYEVYQAKNYEQAIEIVDKKINEYNSKYNDLCGKPHNDQLKQKFTYLRTDINALYLCGQTCENLSYDDQNKVSEYARKQLKQNHNLEELGNGNIVCW